MQRLPSVLAGVVLLGAVAAGCGSHEPELLPVPSGLPVATAQPQVVLRAPGYSITFPGAAAPYEQHYVSHGQPATLHGYKASDLAGGYFLITRAPAPGTAQIDLDGLMNASVAAVGGTMQSSRAVGFRGHPAREVRYTTTLAGTDLTFFVVAIDAGNAVVQLQYAVPVKNVTQEPPLFNEVLDTLTLR